jgi:hypothetical protein
MTTKSGRKRDQEEDELGVHLCETGDLKEENSCIPYTVVGNRLVRILMGKITEGCADLLVRNESGVSAHVRSAASGSESETQS